MSRSARAVAAAFSLWLSGCGPQADVRPDVEISAEARARIDRERDLYRAAWSSGNTSSALEQARALLSSAETAYGSAHPATTALALDVAALLIEQHRDREAFGLYGASAEKIQARSGPDALELVEVHRSLARLHVRATRNGLARKSYREALRILERQQPVDPLALAKLTMEAGASEGLGGNDSRARLLLHRAAELLGDRADDDGTLCLIWLRLGRSADRAQYLQQAVEYYLRAEAALERIGANRALFSRIVHTRLNHLFERLADVDQQNRYAQLAIAAENAEAGPIEGPGPKYRGSAYTYERDGWAIVDLTVEPEGTVSGVRIVDSEPLGVFDDVVLEAVRSWRYAPDPNGPTPRRALLILS